MLWVSAYPRNVEKPNSEPWQWSVVAALGTTQIFAWGCSYYLPAVLATPVSVATGWPLAWVLGGLSLGLIVAGLASPTAGRAIQDYGGRRVLAISSILLAAGLTCLGLSQSISTYLVGWIVIGFGMGTGLYDAAFATLGQIYEERARGAIAMLTLFGGFSSTICWPFSWWLVQTSGWRIACFVSAGLQILLSLPIHLLLLPKLSDSPAAFSPNLGHGDIHGVSSLWPSHSVVRPAHHRSGARSSWSRNGHHVDRKRNCASCFVRG